MRWVLTHLLIGGVFAVCHLSAATLWGQEEAESAPMPAASSSRALTPYFATLKKHDYAPSSTGALDYLRRIELDEKQQSRIARLIEQMGDADYYEREAAMAELTLLPTPNRDLALALEHENLEIRWRAKRVVERNHHESSAMLMAALQVVAVDPADATLQDLLPALPWCNAPHLRRAAHDALLATATAGDAPRLRELLNDGSPEERIAAFYVLAKRWPKADRDLLRQRLEQSEEQVMLETAKIFADLGERASLSAFVRLLASKNESVRIDTISALRAFTGMFFGYRPHDEPEQQAETLEKWKTWLRDASATAELRYPLRRFRDGRGDLAGNTLVATGSAGKVMELNPDGEIVWSYDINSWSAEKLPNGHVLIASYSSNRVVIVDNAGRSLWELPSINAMTARPLTDGNILIADFNGNRVVEVNDAKNIVWEYKTPDNCFDASRLPSGNTIFGCPNLVREVSPEGETVREWKIPGRLNGFQPLPDGGLLIANYGEGKIQEMSADGKINWEFREPNPCDAFRLPGGGMLVSTATRVIEVSADRQVVKEITKANYGSARR